VDECNSCKHGFHASRAKRKSHCRHCGKVFCPDCLTKSVPSGPHGRPGKSILEADLNLRFKSWTSLQKLFITIFPIPIPKPYNPSQNLT
jgi:hypothetical protein